jgi:hypothetical protein
MDNGWLKAPARISRVGIQAYRQPDGTIRRELRPPEEVFHADSIASFGLVPVTDDHPGPVSADNTRAFQVGTLGENLIQDGDFLAGTVMLTDPTAIAKADSGKVQLSCGYTCDVEDKPGMWRGQPYDGIQRNIRGNHVALVHVGRAGPEVRIRLDSQDAIAVVSSVEQIPDPGPREEPMSTKKVKFDAAELELPEAAAVAVERERSLHQDALTASKAEVSKHQARADVAESKVKELEAKLSAATDPKAIQAAVSARVALETTGREVLGNAFKADASDDDIKRAVIAKRLPAVKLDGKDGAYVAAVFEAALATQAPAEKRPATAPLPETKQDSSGSAYHAARLKFMQETKQAWTAGKK